MTSAQAEQLPRRPEANDDRTSEENEGQDRGSWSEAAHQAYRSQYGKWMPWVEDLYLRWFTKDNKASYTAKDTLSKTKVTGIEQVDALQDGVNNLAAGQVGQGGLAQPLGDAMSREGINRAERGGPDGSFGGYPPSAGPGPAGRALGGVTEGAQNIGGGVVEGGRSLGRGVGGIVGGK